MKLEMGTLTKEKILESMKSVKDPDLQRDIVSLGMVKEVGIEGGKVSIHVELTTPACPLKEQIKQDVQKAVAAVEGVKEVSVQMSSQVRRAPTLLPAGTPSGVKNIIAVASGKGGGGEVDRLRQPCDRPRPDGSEGGADGWRYLRSECSFDARYPARAASGDHFR